MKRTQMWIAAILAMCSMGVQAQEKVKMVYPQAEWHTRAYGSKHSQ